jgi:ribosomal protein S18 acetylase RimI-like enzyme
MTLGVLDECRGLGMGSLLLEETYKAVAFGYPDCKVIYLHVIEYN